MSRLLFLLRHLADSRLDGQLPLGRRKRYRLFRRRRSSQSLAKRREGLRTFRQQRIEVVPSSVGARQLVI